jgi:hypothetical protein
MNRYMILAIAVAIGALGMMSIPKQAECYGDVCGNSCMSTADCMGSCLCLQFDPPNTGVCVSIDDEDED